MITCRRILELLKEQQIQPDEVFLTEGGDFLVSDLTDNDIRSVRIHTEERFSQFLCSTEWLGTRIISIPADSTIEPLNISPSWAARLLDSYRVRSEFLQILLAFGDEPQHAEACNGNDAFYESESQGFELLYKLNYMEPNNRKGQNPWSTRHLGVYHRHETGRDLYVLIHCSKESMLYAKLTATDAETRDPSDPLNGVFESPTSLHDVILQCYAQYWRPYLRWMGEDYDQINTLAAVSDTSDAGKESFGQLRRLRMLRDYTDLASGYCISNLQVLFSLRLSMKASCGSTDSILAVENSARSHVKSLKLLKDRIDNTIQLISLTVDLRNQEQAASLNQDMKKLAQETGAVTKKLAVISEHSANETEVVRVITIVSAIYLPGSFVTSIFGMNFFQFDKQAGIAVSRGIWIFISAWVGLTVVTGAILALVYGRNRRGKESLRHQKSSRDDMQSNGWGSLGME